MLDVIERGTEKNPRSLILVLSLLASIFVLPLCLLVALPLMIVSKRLTGLAGTLLVLGLLLSFILWQVFHIQLINVMQVNHHVLKSVLSGRWVVLTHYYYWLLSVPGGLILSFYLHWLRTKQSSLQGELLRVARGKFKYKQSKLTPAELSKRLDKIKSSACEGGSVLGLNSVSGKSVMLDDASANTHTLAIGTTGSGKTTSIGNIVESVIARNLPLIYVDGKGDQQLAKSIGELAKQQGRKFYLFSMTGKSVKYNPIASGGITSKKDRIIELRIWSEDHYRKIAEGYLQTVFSLLVQFNIKPDLYSLSKYLLPDGLYSLAREQQAESAITDIELLENHVKDVYSLIAEINNMSNSEIGHLFDTSQGEVLTLEKALAENAIVYFCLQPLAFPAYAECLGKLIINDIKALAAQQLNKTSKTKLYTIFDEFSIFAGDQIVNLINQGRSAGIHAILATQSLSDISKKGGDALVGQVLNNCNNYIIQRQNNHDDAEMLAKLIGTHDAFQLTSQIDDSSGSRGVGSVRAAKEFLVHPDEIKNFARGEGIVMNKTNHNLCWTVFRRGIIN